MPPQVGMELVGRGNLKVSKKKKNPLWLKKIIYILYLAPQNFIIYLMPP